MTRTICTLVAAALTSCLGLTSCATIVSDSTWPVTIDTQPPGASVIVRDEEGKTLQAGTTPCMVMLDSGGGFFQRASYAIETTLPGQLPQQTTLTSHFNAWYIGNIVFGGLIGILIVDPLTGAMYRFDRTVLIDAATGAILEPPKVESTEEESTSP